MNSTSTQSHGGKFMMHNDMGGGKPQGLLAEKFGFHAGYLLDTL